MCQRLNLTIYFNFVKNAISFIVLCEHLNFVYQLLAHSGFHSGIQQTCTEMLVKTRQKKSVFFFIARLKLVQKHSGI